MKASSASTRVPVLVTAIVLSIAALVLTTSINLLVDAGALAHDIICPTHGWIR